MDQITDTEALRRGQIAADFVHQFREDTKDEDFDRYPPPWEQFGAGGFWQWLKRAISQVFR